MSIGQQIRKARDKKGLTQTELATRSGVSRPTIARAERGEQVSMRTVSKLADALGLMFDLFER